jgi:hypothetical protein
MFEWYHVGRDKPENYQFYQTRVPTDLDVLVPFYAIPQKISFLLAGNRESRMRFLSGSLHDFDCSN